MGIVKYRARAGQRAEPRLRFFSSAVGDWCVPPHGEGEFCRASISERESGAEPIRALDCNDEERIFRARPRGPKC